MSAPGEAFHDWVAELSVVGALLLDPAAGDTVAELLDETDFHLPVNRALYRAIRAVWGRGEPVDVVAVNNELLRSGGDVPMEHIADAMDAVATAAGVEHHARLVRSMAQRRQLAAIAGELGAAARGERPVEEVIDATERLLYACGDRGGGDTLARVDAKLITDTIGLMAEGRRGVPSGFPDLDDLTLGFSPGDLWVLAGSTSMGKTALALQIARHAAANAGPVAFFTLEMMREELVWRLLCAEGLVDGQTFRRHGGDASPGALDRLCDAATVVNTLPLHLDETSAATITHVRGQARRTARREGGLSLIVVDHLQIMGTTGRESRHVALAEITGGLKALAKDLRVPVLLLSQLSRFKDRADKRPQLSDLRESGAIEQDANGVMFVYRPEYYHGARGSDGADLRGKAELIVAKQRNGATGTVKLFFRAAYARFESRAWRPG